MAESQGRPLARRHFLSLLDFTRDELCALLDRADLLRAAWRAGALPRALEGAWVGLWHEGTGFRNRVAFDIGVRALGGEVVEIPGVLAEREEPEDVARYLGSWLAAIAIRARDHAAVERFAAASPIPVINARTAHNHPCEILGDLQFVRRQRGGLEGLKVVYVGEASNIGNSWLEAGARLPLRVVQVCPPAYAPAPEALAAYRDGSVGSIELSTDLAEALEGADVVCTDCWPRTRDPEAAARVRALFAPYCITGAELATRAPDALFLPCPPVTRGEEVDAAAMRSPACRVFEAKDHLLHTQNAILEALAVPRWGGAGFAP